MTWSDFYVWLERNGVKHSPGDIHYAGRGYWFPNPPDVTRGEEDPKPPGPWVLIEKDRGSTSVMISSNVGKAKFAEDPASAKEAVERLLMAVYRAQDEGLAGFRGFSRRDREGRTYFPRLGNRQERRVWSPGTARSLFKTCNACGCEYTRPQWEELDFIGEQEIEADRETGEEACVYEARNCACTGTMYALKD